MQTISEDSTADIMNNVLKILNVGSRYKMENDDVMKLVGHNGVMVKILELISIQKREMDMADTVVNELLIRRHVEKKCFYGKDYSVRLACVKRIRFDDNGDVVVVYVDKRDAIKELPLNSFLSRFKRD